MSDILYKIQNTSLKAGLALLPANMDTKLARQQLMTTGLQESRYIYRKQVKGPAVGFYQFETAGIRGVLTHETTKKHALAACAKEKVAPTVAAVYTALPQEQYDNLAVAFARLNLWWHHLPLPDDAESAWKYYLHTWRPGAVARDYANLHHKWLNNWTTVRKFLHPC
ncbi:MAG: hypothetical protein ACOH2T_19050 [Pseudomonas sp.]